jgi:hypothetical protein
MFISPRTCSALLPIPLLLQIARDEAEDRYIDLPPWALGERSHGDQFAGSMTLLGAAMLCILIAVIAGAVLRVRQMRQRDSHSVPIYSSGNNAV